MSKYGELQYLLEGLKNSIAKMEHGINNKDDRYIRAEIRYFREKSESILSEAKWITDANS